MSENTNQPAAEAGEGRGQGDGRPNNLVLAGAGSLLAVLAFLGGTAVGHAWDGTSTQQNQFGGPGGGRQFPGQQGQVPGQQGQLPGQQSQVPGQQGQGSNQGTQPDDGQTQTS